MSERPVTPMPVPMEGSERPELVVLFGGTFDPPHRGHVELPVRVRDELELRAGGGCVGKAWLVYVPAERSPHKERGPAASDADRVEMLKLSLAGIPRAGVWTDEIDRASGASQTAEPSYTIDTLNRACSWLDGHSSPSARVDGAHAPAIPLRLLIGADQAIGFHRWRSPREIVRIAHPTVMVRGDVADAEDLVRRLKQTRFWKRDELEAWREGMVSVGRMDVSATRMREALRDGNAEEARRWLGGDVLGYVREKGLYGGTEERRG